MSEVKSALVTVHECAPVLAPCRKNPFNMAVLVGTGSPLILSSVVDQE